MVRPQPLKLLEERQAQGNNFLMPIPRRQKQQLANVIPWKSVCTAQAVIDRVNRQTIEQDKCTLAIPVIEEQYPEFEKNLENVKGMSKSINK